jgi:uncharacterized protein (DUF1684 family)
MSGVTALVVLTLLAGAGVGGAAADDDYVSGIEKWRADFDADVRTGGWLEAIGRYPLGEGTTRLGSGPGSDIVLPERAPAQLGVLTRHGRWVAFTPAPGTPVTIDGQAIPGLVELSTERGKSRIHAGDFETAVRDIGGDLYVMVRDSHNPAIARFKGIEWFPVDPAWRVPATFVQYAKPEERTVPLTHIDSKETMTSSGYVTFRLGGRTLRLRTFKTSDGLFIMFQDRSNGRESYGGGRFLNAPPPKDGTTVLDFNKAFNPYCSVNEFVVCPVPPPENRLAVRVAAGEKYTRED